MVLLTEETLLLDLEADSSQAAIRALGARLTELGYAEPDYAEAAVAREGEYPTGLPTEEVFTALPHALGGTVHKTGVAVGRLKTPVEFRCMGAPDTVLPVSLVFLLANASGEGEHLTALQELMDCFCRVGFLPDLMRAGDPEEFLAIFSRAETYPEA